MGEIRSSNEGHQIIPEKHHWRGPWPMLYTVDDDDEDAPRRLPKLTVGAGPRAALLDARTSLLDAPWRLARASVLKRRWVLCRVVADGSTNMVRGARLELRAPLIVRNHLPVAVDLQVMQQQGTDKRVCC